MVVSIVVFHFYPKLDAEQPKRIVSLVEIALALLNFRGWLVYHSTKHGFVVVPWFPENIYLQQHIALMSKFKFFLEEALWLKFSKSCSEISLNIFWYARAVSAKIFVGTHDLYKVTGKHTIASSVFYEHPYYDPKEIKNDVALVELPKEIGFDGNQIIKFLKTLV